MLKDKYSFGKFSEFLSFNQEDIKNIDTKKQKYKAK